MVSTICDSARSETILHFAHCPILGYVRLFQERFGSQIFAPKRYTSSCWFIIASIGWAGKPQPSEESVLSFAGIRGEKHTKVQSSESVRRDKTRKTSSPWTVTLSWYPGEFFTEECFRGCAKALFGGNFPRGGLIFSAGNFRQRAVVQGEYRDPHAVPVTSPYVQPRLPLPPPWLTHDQICQPVRPAFEYKTRVTCLPTPNPRIWEPIYSESTLFVQKRLFLGAKTVKNHWSPSWWERGLLPPS